MALINKAHFQFKTSFCFLSFFVTFHIQSFTSIIRHKTLWTRSYKPSFTKASCKQLQYLTTTTTMMMTTMTIEVYGRETIRIDILKTTTIKLYSTLKYPFR